MVAKMEIKRVITPEGKNLRQNLKALEGMVGRVGWFENSKYPDKEKTPVAFVAAQNEFGNPSKHIPARPFMRPTISEKKNEWSNIAFEGSKAVIEGRRNIGQVMDAIGLKASADIRKKISTIWEPPLSPYTIAARLKRKSNKKVIGNLTKPLIDTGLMYGTLINTTETE